MSEENANLAFNPSSQANMTGFSLLCIGAILLGISSYTTRAFEGKKDSWLPTSENLQKGGFSYIISSICLMITGLTILFLFD